MLEEQLKNASKAASQRRTKLALTVVGMVGGALALVVAFTFILGPSRSENQSAPSEQADMEITAPQNAMIRDDFKNALKDFESTHQSRVSHVAFKKWNGDAQHTILTAKDNAISLFSTGDYTQAVKTLKSAATLATSELQAMDAAFDAALKQAAEHYAKDAYDLAKIEVAKALALRPGDPNALAQKVQIDSLPQVLHLLKSAQAAKVENDLEGEVKKLREALALAPHRANLKDRLQALEAELVERTFSSHIKSGIARVADRNLKGAKSSLNAAEKLLPAREELKLLRAQVHKLSETLKLEALLESARQAAEGDDWQRVLTLYDKAAKIEPNNKTVIEGSATAKAILSLNARIDGHLGRSERLSSSNVMAAAKTLVNDSATYFARSPNLKAKSVRLAGIIDGYGAKVAVLVRSDNLTEILVRGVGRVGQTQEKQIELNPGTYTFEGIRAGFKARLVRVSVEPNASDVIVEVICNERL